MADNDQADVARLHRWWIVRHIVIVVLQAMVFIGGCVLAYSSAVWALRTTPDLPVAYAVPARDRAGELPGPPIMYWLIWALPPTLIYGIGGSLFWRWKASRWIVGFLWAGFTVIFPIIALLWIGIDVGGFSPS